MVNGHHLHFLTIKPQNVDFGFDDTVTQNFMYFVASNLKSPCLAQVDGHNGMTLPFWLHS
jgi:hypothetical protein